MKLSFIIALLLAWPTFGLSLVALVIYTVLKMQSRRQLVDGLLVSLAREGSIIGTAIPELTYDGARNYIDGNCRDIGTIDNPLNGWIEFERFVDGRRYVGELTRTHDGRGAVLKARHG